MLPLTWSWLVGRWWQMINCFFLHYSESKFTSWYHLGAQSFTWALCISSCESFMKYKHANLLKGQHKKCHSLDWNVSTNLKMSGEQLVKNEKLANAGSSAHHPPFRAKVKLSFRYIDINLAKIKFNRGAPQLLLKCVHKLEDGWWAAGFPKPTQTFKSFGESD